jgi:uncharacterized secreted protein with C-terminal beta-propeller domain
VVVDTPAPAKKPAASSTPVKAHAAALKRFRDCTAITNDLRANALRYVGPYGLPGGYAGGPVAFAAQAGVAEDRSAAGAPAAAPAAPQAGVDYSQTNVQEEGVDEPDTVKTDGRRIFVVAGQTLHAVDLTGTVPRLAGSLKLDTWGMQLLLSGDRLMVISAGGPVMMPMVREGAPGGAAPPYQPGGPQTTVQVVDVSNPGAIRVVGKLSLDGQYVDGRQIDGVARLVVQRPNPAIPFAYPQDGTPAAMNSALAANRAAVSRATTTQWIPRYKLESGATRREGAVSSCSNTYRPTVFSGFGSVTVVTVDPHNPVPHAGSTVIGSGGTVYASRSNVYVTSQRLPVPMPMAISRPADIAPVPDATEIHKFDISSQTAVYKASGVVDGTVLNQFSMSEYNGDLRIATTSGPVSEFPGQSASTNAVAILRQVGNSLTQIGRVGALGANQRIYAVRFIGPVAYIVTFRQIDPLYAIDLRNPHLPHVVGELHIPGFSAYLHPISATQLLGIGDSVDANARPVSTKASLFDVSDLAHPRDVQDLKLAGPTFGQFDHHGFLWWGPKHLAVIPVQSYNAETPEQKPFAGAVTIDIGSTMRVLKTLSHPANSQQQFPITRSLVADNLLFTVSEGGIMASDLGSLSERAWLPF